VRTVKVVQKHAPDLRIAEAQDLGYAEEHDTRTSVDFLTPVHFRRQLDALAVKS
jgi:hypothetical protein